MRVMLPSKKAKNAKLVLKKVNNEKNKRGQRMASSDVEEASEGSDVELENRRSKRKTPVRKVASSDEESPSEDADDTQKESRRRTRKAPLRKTAASDSESAPDDDDDDTQKASKRSKRKTLARKTASSDVESASEDYDDDTLKTSKRSKRKTPARKTAASDLESAPEDDDDAQKESKRSKRKTSTRKAASSDVESAPEDDDDDDAQTERRKRTRKTPVRKAAASDSESAPDDNDDDDTQKASKRSKRKTPARKTASSDLESAPEDEEDAQKENKRSKRKRPTRKAASSDVESAPEDDDDAQKERRRSTRKAPVRRAASSVSESGPEDDDDDAQKGKRQSKRTTPIKTSKSPALDLESAPENSDDDKEQKKFPEGSDTILCEAFDKYSKENQNDTKISIFRKIAEDSKLPFLNFDAERLRGRHGSILRKEDRIKNQVKTTKAVPEDENQFIEELKTALVAAFDKYSDDQPEATKRAIFEQIANDKDLPFFSLGFNSEYLRKKHLKIKDQENKNKGISRLSKSFGPLRKGSKRRAASGKHYEGPKSSEIQYKFTEDLGKILCETYEKMSAQHPEASMTDILRRIATNPRLPFAKFNHNEIALKRHYKRLTGDTSKPENTRPNANRKPPAESFRSVPFVQTFTEKFGVELCEAYEKYSEKYPEASQTYLFQEIAEDSDYPFLKAGFSGNVLKRRYQRIKETETKKERVDPSYVLEMGVILWCAYNKYYKEDYNANPKDIFEKILEDKDLPFSYSGLTVKGLQYRYKRMKEVYHIKGQSKPSIWTEELKTEFLEAYDKYLKRYPEESVQKLCDKMASDPKLPFLELKINADMLRGKVFTLRKEEKRSSLQKIRLQWTKKLENDLCDAFDSYRKQYPTEDHRFIFGEIAEDPKLPFQETNAGALRTKYFEIQKNKEKNITSRFIWTKELTKELQDAVAAYTKKMPKSAKQAILKKISEDSDLPFLQNELTSAQLYSKWKNIRDKKSASGSDEEEEEDEEEEASED